MNFCSERETISSRRQLYYQQNAAPCQCCKRCLDILSQKFQQRVTSRSTDCPWPRTVLGLGEMDDVIARGKLKTDLF